MHAHRAYAPNMLAFPQSPHQIYSKSNPRSHIILYARLISQIVVPTYVCTAESIISNILEKIKLQHYLIKFNGSTINVYAMSMCGECTRACAYTRRLWRMCRAVECTAWCMWMRMSSGHTECVRCTVCTFNASACVCAQPMSGL